METRERNSLKTELSQSIDKERRKFAKALVAGVAFTVPFMASFSMDGLEFSVEEAQAGKLSGFGAGKSSAKKSASKKKATKKKATKKKATKKKATKKKATKKKAAKKTATTTNTTIRMDRGGTEECIDGGPVNLLSDSRC